MVTARLQSLWVCFYVCLYSADRSSNLHARIKSLTLSFLGILLPMLLFVDLFARNMSKDVLDSFLGSSGTELLLLYLVRLFNIVFFSLAYDAAIPKGSPWGPSFTKSVG